MTMDIDPESTMHITIIYNMPYGVSVHC